MALRCSIGRDVKDGTNTALAWTWTAAINIVIWDQSHKVAILTLGAIVLIDAADTVLYVTEVTLANF